LKHKTIGHINKRQAMIKKKLKKNTFARHGILRASFNVTHQKKNSMSQRKNPDYIKIMNKTKQLFILYWLW